MASSRASLKRRYSSSEEKENSQQNSSNNKEIDEQTKRLVDDQQVIRSNVVEEFRKRNLHVPLEMIGTTLLQQTCLQTALPIKESSLCVE